MKFNNPHSGNDALHLALDQATAAKIRARPELVEIGRQNLHRWRVRSEGELSPAHQEWELILRFLTPDEVADFIVGETPRARRLRQSSPMVGILTEAERLAILYDHEK